MLTIEGILMRHPFFKGLEVHHLQFIAGCGTNVHFDSGQYIFREGGEADYFYVIRKGKVSLDVFSPTKGPVALLTVPEGDVLGWSWLFPPYRWHFDARATESTTAIRLDAKCLRDKCEEDHVLGYELMKRFSGVVVQRLQASLLQVLDLYSPKG